MLFLAPSRVTRAYILLQGPRPKDKQTKWRKKLLSSFPPLNLRQDREDNQFDNNSEYDEDCVNAILIMLITIVRGFFFNLTNPVTKRGERCRAMNIPFRQKKLPGKGGWKVNNNNNNNNNLCLNHKSMLFVLGQRIFIRNKTQTAVTNMKLNKRIAKTEFHSPT